MVLERRHIINEHNLSLLHYRLLKLLILLQSIRVGSSSSRWQQQWAESHLLERRFNWGLAEAPGDRTSSTTSGHQKSIALMPLIFTSTQFEYPSLLIHTYYRVTMRHIDHSHWPSLNIPGSLHSPGGGSKILKHGVT